ncbi:hypothetical protein BCR34DRAFT_525252 [Clohesyomyces aquaticus]|uniref:Hypersensitive response-inducing protein n=1 Tax=Clohesyomyces aquaticus TaxID=1231657 RepID=A0A1Y1YD65_9PLEO|nr:hypothetical protein BCR34DRAFT_525252 [Clohesyomyces aquaticus]
MFSKLSALTVLATAATAIAAPAAAATDKYQWLVTGYTNTCTAATCYYGFNVSGETGPRGQPAFDATGCSGNTIPTTLKSCAVVGLDLPGDVETSEENLGIDVGANVFVKLSFHQEGVEYTYTGNQTVKPTFGGPLEFYITPTVVTGVPDKA